MQDEWGLLDRAASWPGRRWRAFGAAGAAVGALALGAIGYSSPQGAWRAASAVAGGLFGAILGGGVPLAVYLLLTQRVRARQTDRQVRAFANVRPITGRLPMDLDGWAADPVLADEVVRTVVRREPDMVLECGSGWTTVLVARCLEELQTGRIVALEHEERFAERSRRLLDRYGGSQRATVVHAPVTEREVEGQPRPWYGPEAEEAVTERLDLLLVDGPPGPLAPESRYPAVPLLKDCLATDAVVFLDDGRRPEEARIAEAWAEQLGVEPQFVDAGSGIWVFELEQATAESYA